MALLLTLVAFLGTFGNLNIQPPDPHVIVVGRYSTHQTAGNDVLKTKHD